MILLKSLYNLLELSPAGLGTMFILLPVFFLICRMTPARYRAWTLTGISFLYIALISVQAAAGMALLIVSAYLFLRLRQIDGQPKHGEKIYAWSGAAVIFIIILASGWFSGLHIYRSGILVVVASAISVLTDAYAAPEPYKVKTSAFLLYFTFFPRLFAGPLISYGDFEVQCENLDCSAKNFFTGYQILIKGAFKAKILGGELFLLLLQLKKISSVSVLSGWTQVLAAAFSLYYLLSGYSDMARGAGKIFGITLPENWKHPFTASCAESFLASFQTTVGSFIRKQTDSENKFGITEILLYGTLMGLWLSPEQGAFLWGLLMALIICAERHLFNRVLEKIPLFFRKIVTLISVFLCFALFSSGTLAEIPQLIGGMLNFGSFSDEQALYLLSSNRLLLAVSLVAASNIVGSLFTKFSRHYQLYADILRALTTIFALTAYLALTL